jgi:glycosyltransferase involved in cell wall biosynthesis
MGARLKVAHIITRLDLGGAQRNTLHTVLNLDRSRFEAMLICGPGGLLDDEARAWPDDAPPVRFVPDLVREIRPWRDFQAFRRLRRILLETRPEVVHTHSSKAGILGRLAAAAAGVPVIIHTFHGFGLHERQPWLTRSIYLLAERLSARVSTALVFVSRANQEYAQRLGLGGAPSWELIRSGVDLSRLPATVDPAAKKRELGLAPETRLVLSVGNFKPQKNPEDMLAAAKIVAARCRNAAFVFVGDGPLRARLETGVRQAGLERSFLMPGWRRDVAELLACADAFALTSLWEGLPRSLVEAMKSGVPPVCYATDGVLDLIRDGENGFAPAQGDVSALAERLLALLQDDGLRRRIAAAAAASVGAEFDIQEMVRRQEELYSRLWERRA